MSRYPLSLTFDDLGDVLANVRSNGSLNRYDIFIHEKSGKKSFVLMRCRPLMDDEDSLTVSFKGHDSVEDLKAIAAFLGLEPDIPPIRPFLNRSSFIAHRFNDTGDECSERLARFLQLLGFDTTSGRAFAPGSVAEKVKNRLAERAIVFAILTPSDDKTWLVQESLLASLSNKPLFLIKDDAYALTSGLLSDHEYIPFKSPNIETTFIQVLEGLRELGFKF